MLRLSKTHLTWAFIAIVALRFVIGFHFFREGTSKLNTDWTAEYFLRAAKGPLSPLYHHLVDDMDGRLRLCVTEVPDGEKTKMEFDAAVTSEIFRDFGDRAVNHFRFGDVALLKELDLQRDVLAVKIQKARESRDPAVDVRKLESARKEAEQQILAVRQQVPEAGQIVENHVAQLEQWLAYNEVELKKHFATADRLEGFDRDGQNRDMIATYVSSAREQIETIQKDRQSELKRWTSEIEAIYDSLEIQINELAVATQKDRPFLTLHRPYNRPNSYLKWIDTVLPWFDTIVGALLILGLFTRLAALSGGLFLLSVCLSQPFWIPGTQDTIYQAIEMFGLFVLFALCAGRIGGLDYFLTSHNNYETEEREPESATA